MHLPLVEGGDSRVHRQREAVEAVPVSTVRAVSRGDAGQVVAVEGVARSHERPVSAPLTGEECLVAGYERRRRTDGDYEVDERRVEAVPFVVAGDTGEVVVEPGDADEGGGRAADPDPFAVSARNTTWYVGDRAGESVRPVEDPAAIAPERVEWVHRVATIPPGEEVYVLGEAAVGTDGVRIRAGEGAFVVSDMGRSALVEALRRASPDVSGQFLRFAVLGAIAVVLVLAVIVILVVTLAP